MFSKWGENVTDELQYAIGRLALRLSSNCPVCFHFSLWRRASEQCWENSVFNLCVRVNLLSVSKFNLQKQLDDFIYLRHRTTESPGIKWI